jgi:hypothetical protein
VARRVEQLLLDHSMRVAPQRRYVPRYHSGYDALKCRDKGKKNGAT